MTTRLSLFILCFSLKANAIEIIMNHSVPVKEIDSTTVWSIFGKQVSTWTNGNPITVFVLNDENPFHAEFTKQVLNTFPYQLRRSWDRRTFSGTGQAPIEVKSWEDMFKSVVNTPGSVGYLPDKWDGDSVKTLRLTPNQ